MIFLGLKLPASVLAGYCTYLAVRWVEQIDNLFVIKFHKLCRNFKLRRQNAAFLGLFDFRMHPVEKMVNGSRDNAFLVVFEIHVESGTHGIGFAGTSLAVGKNCGIITKIKEMGQTDLFYD